MKPLFVTLLLFASTHALALTGREAWTHSSIQGKVWLLNEYKAFFTELQKEEGLGELEEVTKNQMFFSLLSSAWAEEGMDCIYAGWPSKRIKNVCSSPVSRNPDYRSGTCGKNQLQCQPLLFGKGLCVPVSTQSERSLAFSNCDKKYRDKKDSPDALIREIRADGNEKALFELMDFADNICQKGAQRGTGMCRRLEAAVDRLRHFKTEAPVEVATADQQPQPQQRGPAVIPGAPVGRGPRRAQTPEQQQLIQTVTKASEVLRVVTAEDCAVETNGEPFDRDEPRPLIWDGDAYRPGKDPAWDNIFVKDERTKELRPKAFELMNVGPNSIAGDPLDPLGKVSRRWQFVSEDHSRRETYIWITDDSGTSYESNLMDSVLMIVPRKMKPKIEAVGEDLHVTLTTGEKIIYDKKTKVIRGGVLTERPIDLHPLKQDRKFAQVSYNGTGISIRIDKRGDDPRVKSSKATVTQNGQSCEVPVRDLWNANKNFKYSDDNKLVDYLNKKCGKKFTLN